MEERYYPGDKVRKIVGTFSSDERVATVRKVEEDRVHLEETGGTWVTTSDIVLEERHPKNVKHARGIGVDATFTSQYVRKVHRVQLSLTRQEALDLFEAIGRKPHDDGTQGIYEQLAEVFEEEEGVE